MIRKNPDRTLRAGGSLRPPSRGTLAAHRATRPGHAKSPGDAPGPALSDPGPFVTKGPGAGQACTGNGTPRHEDGAGLAPARTGHPRKIATWLRLVPVQCRGDARPGDDDESAGEDRPCHAHVRWAGRGQAGRPGIASSARRLPRCHRGLVMGDSRCPVSHPARNPVAGISSDTVGAPAADAGDARPWQRSIWLASPAGGHVGGAARPSRPRARHPATATLMWLPAHPGQHGGRQSGLPPGQEPA